MISRYIFISEMKKMNDKYGVIFPLGASDTVDKIGRELVKKYGNKVLEETAKLNFKNTSRILDN